MRKIEIVQDDLTQNLKDLVWAKLQLQNTFNSLYHAGFTGHQINEVYDCINTLKHCIDRQEAAIDSIRDVRRQES